MLPHPRAEDRSCCVPLCDTLVSLCSVDDCPTITHAGMPSGAAVVAAAKYGAAEVVDPPP